MTVGTSVNRNDYEGNGATTSFPYEFRIFEDADIVVTVLDASGLPRTLTLGSDYTVTAAGAYAGGNVVFTMAPANGVRIVIRRVLQPVQTTDLRNQASLYPETIEDIADRLTMLVQQLQEQAERAPTISPTAPPGTSTQLPPPVPGGLLGWNEDGTGLVNLSAANFSASQTFASWVYDILHGDGFTTSWVLRAAPGSLANVDVAIDGITKLPGTDYILSGTTLTFTTAPAGGAIVLVRYGSAAVQNAPAFIQELITATAGQTVLPLAYEYAPGANTLAVYVNGLRLMPGVDYQETDAATVTLAEGLEDGDGVLAVYGVEATVSAVGTANLLADAVTTTKIKNGAVTIDKLAAEVRPYLPGDVKWSPCAGPVDTGWAIANGAARSRTADAALFARLCPMQTVTLHDLVANTLTITGHGLDTGTQVRVASTASLPQPLAEPTTYYAIAVDDNMIKLATSEGNALAGTAVDLTLAGSGTITVRAFPWGQGDGVTTFNIPNLVRRFLLGNGGTPTATIGARTGATGGEELHTLTVAEMPSHTHQSRTSWPGYDRSYITEGNAGDVPATGDFGNILPAGGGGAHNTIPPAAVGRWLVKV